jgi:hypothetical protein
MERLMQQPLLATARMLMMTRALCVGALLLPLIPLSWGCNLRNCDEGRVMYYINLQARYGLLNLSFTLEFGLLLATMRALANAWSRQNMTTAQAGGRREPVVGVLHVGSGAGAAFKLPQVALVRQLAPGQRVTNKEGRRA